MSSVMAERGLLESIGGFDEGQPFFEEVDLFLRLSLASEVSVVTEALVRMRSHAQHYSADRIGVLCGRARRRGVAAVLCRERRRNYSDLARALAAARSFAPAWLRGMYSRLRHGPVSHRFG
jgi:hypothetical protein